MNRKLKDRNDWAVLIDYETENIKVSTIPIKRKKFDIFEAKKIASKILKCKYVDGKNLIDNEGNYLGGIYVDDLEFYSQKYKAVILKETEKFTFSDTFDAIMYFKKNNIMQELDKIYYLRSSDE